MRHVLALVILIAASAYTGESPSKAAPVIRDEDLQRVSRELPKQFPWPTTRIVQPTSPGKAPATDLGALPDMTGGDIIIKSMGEFLREEKFMEDSGGGKPLKKEVLTLNKSVEIEQIPTRSVLRSDLIRVINDKASGRTETLQATGNVEVVTPERSGRGETLLYEIKIGPNDVTLKDLYTLEGNRTKNTKAVIWQGDDWIEAERFVNDRRLETFRVIGGPRAVFRMPGSPEKSPAAQAKAGAAVAGAGGAGMLPGLEFAGGGKIKMQADGEMYFEGAMGKLRISRNVFIQQEGAPGPDGQPQPGLRMNADEVILTMEVPPPGQPTTPGTNLFAGGLRSLECTGRVEIRSPPRTVLCDKCVVDMNRKTLHLEMKNPKDEVKVYIQENASAGKILVAPKSITVNMETGEFRAQGAQRMENYTGAVPSLRAEQK